MHAITILRLHEFEGQWRGVYMRVWMEEREGRHIVIKLQSQNLKTAATKEIATEDIFFSFPSIII